MTARSFLSPNKTIDDEYYCTRTCEGEDYRCTPICEDN